MGEEHQGIGRETNKNEEKNTRILRVHFGGHKGRGALPRKKKKKAPRGGMCLRDEEKQNKGNGFG